MRKNIFFILYFGFFVGQALPSIINKYLSDADIKEIKNFFQNLRLDIKIVPTPEEIEAVMHSVTSAIANDANNKNGALSTIKRSIKEELPSAQGVGEGIGRVLTEGIRGARKEAAAAGTEAAALASDVMKNAAKELNQQTDGITDELVEAQNKVLNRFTGNFEVNIGPAVRRIKEAITWNLLHPYDIAKYASIIGSGVGATYFLSWYAPGIAKEYIMKTFITPRPTVLLPGSKIGRWDRFSRWRNKYQSPDMIFPTEVKERLSDIEDITKMIKNDIKAGLKRTYRNIMLWGPPGTGKTLFANVLADKLDMDFCSVTAGSLLQKDVGVQFLNEFEKMARKSRYGMILFIDEADALFVDRNTINISTEQGLEHYKVLNHLLALTGDGSSNFMLIAATNHAQNIDEAMGRRFQERVYMPLPDVQTRQELVALYVKKLLYAETDNGAVFVKHAKEVVTPTLLNELVEQTEGLSGAEIKDIIAQAQNLGLQTKNKQLTVDHVIKALKQGVQKRKDQDNDAVKRKEMAQNKGAVVQLTVCPTNGNNLDVQSSVPIVSADAGA
ncbi:AAA family ATPase [Candidatus Dependentiae bacterium]|nr:MAG: AAA family ATPase [Candidatus Dependentiae bacterium]